MKSGSFLVLLIAFPNQQVVDPDFLSLAYADVYSIAGPIYKMFAIPEAFVKRPLYFFPGAAGLAIGDLRLQGRFDTFAVDVRIRNEHTTVSTVIIRQQSLLFWVARRAPPFTIWKSF